MTIAEMEFAKSGALSIGVELELQIVNSRDYNLARDAADLLAVLEKIDHPGEVKPEITESMIELNSSIHTRHDKLLAEFGDAAAMTRQPGARGTLMNLIEEQRAHRSCCRRSGR